MKPCEPVAEKHETVIVETAGEQILRSVVVDDGPDALTIKKDPLPTCDPIAIEKDNLKESRILVCHDASPVLDSIVEDLTSTICSRTRSQGGHPETPIVSRPPINGSVLR